MRLTRRKWIVLIIIALLIITALLISYKRRHTEPEGQVITVTRQDLPLSVQEVGSIEPLRKVEIKSKIAGQVVEVRVDIGQVVKAGDVLMRLDPLDLARGVNQSLARRGVTTAQLKQAQAQLTFKRKAHDQGAISDAELAIAEGEVTRLQAQGSLEGEMLKASQDQQSYTQIRAPIDGVILARNVQPGEMVAPGIASVVEGKPLLVVAQIEKFLVRTELGQIDVARIRPQSSVEVRVDALPGKRFVGTIYRVAAMAQKSERRKDSNLLVFPVDIAVDRKQKDAEFLKPGMMADVTVELERKPQVIAIPIEALVREDKKISVYKIKGAGQEDELVKVTLGAQNEQLVEILSGVSEGERIRVRPAAPETRNR